MWPWGNNSMQQSQNAQQNASMQQNAAQSQMIGAASSGIITGTGAVIGNGGYTYTTSSNYTHPKNDELVNSIILGQMHKYNIDKDEFDTIQKEIYFTMMDYILKGIYLSQYYDFTFAECEKILPKWKFKSDMNSLLSEDEDGKA